MSISVDQQLIIYICSENVLKLASCEYFIPQADEH